MLLFFSPPASAAATTVNMAVSRLLKAPSFHSPVRDAGHTPSASGLPPWEHGCQPLGLFFSFRLILQSRLKNLALSETARSCRSGPEAPQHCTIRAMPWGQLGTWFRHAALSMMG